MHRTLSIGTATFALLLALASVVSAQEGIARARDIHRLGGSTAFYKPPLTTVTSLKRMGAIREWPAISATVLSQAGTPESRGRVVAAALAGASSSVRAACCSEATPLDGTIVECDVQPGQDDAVDGLSAEGRRVTGGLLTDIRWAGRKTVHGVPVSRHGRQPDLHVPRCRRSAGTSR